MGFKEFYHMNTTCLAKQAQRLQTQPDSLWAQAFRAIYFPNQDFIKVRKLASASWIWTSILQGHDLLVKAGKWIVRDGKSIRVQEDN